MGGRQNMKKLTPKKDSPPAWAIRFFRWYCNAHLCEAVLGDMLELHTRRCSRIGKRKADILFVCNALLFLQPFAIRERSNSQHTNHTAMFQNYFKIAWRTMVRQKMYTSIKIGGFALGLATCIFIFLFIRHELSYDKNYEDGNRIFRLYNEDRSPTGGKGTAFPASTASLIKNDFPEVEKAGRLIPYNWFNAGNNLFRSEEQLESTYEEGFAYADQELLEILGIPMVYGDPLQALAKPNTIVISKRKADKYFPNEDPTGRGIILNDDKSKIYTIGGVMENFPSNSHLQFDFFLTLTGVEFWPGEQTSWCCWNYNPYIKIRPDADPAELEKKLISLRDTYYIRYLEEEGNQAVADIKKYQFFRLQRVPDIYLKSEGIHDAIRHGDIRYVWLFGGVACFILLLACINFVNLSTAKSANRAKEVGLRKVVGSVRSYLVRQFLTESILYSFISFVLAVLLVTLAMPYFNMLAATTLTIPWATVWFLPLLLLSSIVIGVIAGIYPSFYLSAFKPIDVLKGSVARGSKSSKLRSAMVVFQFTTSIILIIGTLIIYRQMNFILNTKVGFDKEQVLLIQGANTLDKSQITFKNELLKLSHVENVTASHYLPVGGTKRDQNQFWHDGKSKEEKSIGAQRWFVDEDYLNTLGMKLIEGRNFMREVASDSQAVIINQAMAKALGFKKPVGERIMNWETYTIVGVVEDFHFESMKGKIEPLCFVLGDFGSILSVKVKTKDMQEVIQSVTALWNKFRPHQPIRYSFLDDNYAKMYEDVQRMGQILVSFTVLVVVVACLGLFALSAFMVEQRNKEISIRLVLGASINNILKLLTQNFVILVLISFVLAVPLAWYLMQKWLEDYVYRTEITWDVFAVAGIISIFIALLTVSYQSVRAALANPATQLRSE
jgi:putative ABC transport system permease protein